MWPGKYNNMKFEMCKIIARTSYNVKAIAQYSELRQVKFPENWVLPVRYQLIFAVWCPQISKGFVPWLDGF